MAAATTLYSRIGGAAAVEAAVDLLYKSLLANDLLKPFFDGVNMTRLRRHQATFLTFAFGGGKEWTGPSMYRAHRKLIQERGLNTSHFDMVGEALVDTLQALSVPQELIDEVLAIVVPLRPIFDPAYEPTEADLKPAALDAAADGHAVSDDKLPAKDTAAAVPGSADEINAEEAQAPLFDRLGGTPALDAVVDTLYTALVADEQLAPFFEGVDMQKLRKHQAQFLTFAFGKAGSKWSGKTLFAAHRRLIQQKGLNTTHFDIVAQHLVAALHTHSVPQPLIDEVLAIVGPTRAVFDPAYTPTAEDRAP